MKEGKGKGKKGGRGLNKRASGRKRGGTSGSHGSVLPSMFDQFLLLPLSTTTLAISPCVSKPAPLSFPFPLCSPPLFSCLTGFGLLAPPSPLSSSFLDFSVSLLSSSFSSRSPLVPEGREEEEGRRSRWVGGLSGFTVDRVFSAAA